MIDMSAQEKIARIIDPKAYDDLHVILNLWGPKAAMCASYNFVLGRVSRANKAADRIITAYPQIENSIKD